MAKFALITGGLVAEIIDTAGGPLASRFTPAYVSGLVPEGPGMVLGGTWDGNAFGAVPVAPPMSDADKNAAMDQEMDRPETLAILEALADLLPGPVQVSALRDLAKTKRRAKP